MENDQEQQNVGFTGEVWFTRSTTIKEMHYGNKVLNNKNTIYEHFRSRVFGPTRLDDQQGSE